MNENNEINQSVAETSTSAAEASVATLEPLSPKKSGSNKMILGVVAVCAIAAIAVGIKLSSTPDPKTVVSEAFTATAAAQKAATEEIYKKVPAAKPLFEGRQGALTTDFDFTVKSVEDNPYAGIANAIIADAGIRGNVSCDPENKTTALSGSVYLKDSQLIDGSVFISPELIVGGIPSFSQTIVSMNPTTFAADYQNSRLNAMNPMSAEELDLFQNIITGEIEYINTVSSISSENMIADIVPILKGALTNATYKYDKANKNYVVSIPGEDVKAAILEYYRYIYFDSEMGTAIEKMVSPMVTADSEMTYEQLMTETIDTIGESIPDMDAVLSLDIQKGLIKTAHMVCTPIAPATLDSSEPVASESDASSDLDVFEPAASSLTLDSIVFDCTMDNTNSTAKIIVDTTDETGEKLSMIMDIVAKLENDAYSMVMDMSVDSSDVTLKMPINLSIAADGAYICDANMDITAYDENVTAGFTSNGTATFENDVLTVSLPASRVYGTVPGVGSAAVVFDLDCTSAPLTQNIAASDNHTALFTMNDQQLKQLFDEYSVGSENLVGRLYSLLMG